MSARRWRVGVGGPASSFRQPRVSRRLIGGWASVMIPRVAQFLIAFLAVLVLGTAAWVDQDRERRMAMVREIERYASQSADWTGTGVIDDRVLEAMRRVTRHEFVRLGLRDKAYENRPLPIGYGQTISQPYIVALMTDLLRPRRGQVALEIGTGSGYQAAVLADLGLRVYTMEIIRPLAERAKARLARLGYRNVTVRWGDGYDGWTAHGPYDAIIVTAAASHIPPPLIAQLKPNGRMVIPVGARFMIQQLVLVTKDADGTVRTRQIVPVAFVPLARGS